MANAFTSNDTNALFEIHASLYLLYSLHTCQPENPAAFNQYNPHLTTFRLMIESEWMAFLTREAPPIQTGGSELIVSNITSLWKNHRASHHPLFDFLETNANRAQMIKFFESDSALNLRFFDLIALSLVGTQDSARAELVQNLWNESGIAAETIQYYSEHITVDVVHGQGWLDNVIQPTVLRTPNAESEILLGACLRLASCARYYDTLLDTIKALDLP